MVSEMENYGPNMLKWKAVTPANKQILLDLDIAISNDNKITFKTYQKELNLYYYIAKHSAHPLGVLRSLVISKLTRYWEQNSLLTDYQHFSGLL